MINFTSIYRPPDSVISVFLDGFMSFYGLFSSWSSPTLICGDCNIHLDTDISSSLNFKSILDSCNLVQHIDFPTHIHGDTLDCLITPSDFTGIGCIGDHFCVGCRLDFRSPSKYTVKQITFRQYHRIDRDHLRCDLLSTAFVPSPPTMVLTFMLNVLVIYHMH